MAVDALGGPLDHAALTGLGNDTHPQYGLWLPPGPLAQRPVQPVRAGTRYYATDRGIEFTSDGIAWLITGVAANAPDVGPSSAEFTTVYQPTNASSLPRTYPVGISRAYFSTGNTGYPGQFGHVVTIRLANDVHQTVYEVTRPVIWQRHAWNLADLWTGWSMVQRERADASWHTVGSGETIDGVVAPAWQNGFSGYPPVYGPVRFRKDAAGYVHMRGLSQGGGLNLVAMTLPVGYRPGEMFMGNTVIAGGGSVRACRINIEPNGNCAFSEAAGGYNTDWQNWAVAPFLAEG